MSRRALRLYRNILLFSDTIRRYNKNFFGYLLITSNSDFGSSDLKDIARCIILYLPTDINECTAGSHDCDATHGTCSNNPGSYVCSCNAGFNLESDNTCTGKGLCSQCKVFIIHGVYIVRLCH